MSRKILSKLLKSDRRVLIGNKIKDLRTETKMRQQALAGICGVSGVQVSRWEHALDLPSAKALLKISELVPEPERDWWRDQAAEQAGFMLAPQSPSEDDAHRKIRLLRDPISAGIPRVIEERDVERLIQLPRDWLPVGGDLVAAKVKGDSMRPMIDEGDILIVDLSQKRKEELAGKIVIARLDDHVFVKRLKEVSGIYFLEPENENFQPTTIKRGSGWEIVGCVVKWIKNEPGAMRR